MRCFERFSLAAGILCLVAAGPAVAQSGGATSGATAAQGIEQALRVPIDQLFNGMKARDTLMITGAFVPVGRLIGIRDRDGQTTVSTLAPADFARSLLRAPAGDLIERYWDLEYEVDANVASVWVKYDFHIGERFSHCGIDALQLAKTHEGWKIVQIMDTRQTTGCTVPPK